MSFRLPLRSVWLVPLLLAALAPTLSGQSVIFAETFERSRLDAEGRVERKLRREFSRQIDQIERLKAPYRIGDTVTVTLTRGNRSERLTGRFNGIVQSKYVKISSSRILLDDIDPNDRDLLIWDNDEERLAALIAERQAQLAEEMDKVRHKYLRDEMHALNYDDEFFQNNVRVGAKICHRDLMAHGKLTLTLIAEADSDFVNAELRNTSSQRLDAIIVIDNLPMGAMVTSGLDHEDPAKGFSHSFHLKRADLSANFFEALPEGISVVCQSPIVGSWRLLPYPRAIHRNGFVQRLGETVEVQRSKIAFVAPSREKDGPLPEVESVPPHLFAAMVETVQQYAAETEPLAAAEAAERQAAVDAAAAATAEPDGAEEAAAPETDDKPAAPVADEVDLSGLMKSLRQPGLGYKWAVPKPNPEGATEAHLENLKSNDPEEPRQLGDHSINYLSDWQPVEVISGNLLQATVNLALPQFRILIADGGRAALLQYSGALTSFTSYPQIAELTAVVKVGKRQVELVNELKLEPNWGGQAFISNVIGIDLVRLGIGSVTVTQLAGRPE